MSLADDVTAHLPFLRAQAESLMSDTIRIEHLGDLVTNPETGTVEPSREIVYEGPCKVQANSALANTAEAGGAVFTVQRAEVHFPALTAGLEVGLIGTIVAAPHQPALVGDQYRLTEPAGKSWQTAQRWGVESA